MFSFCLLSMIQTEFSSSKADPKELEQMLSGIALEDRRSFERFYEATDKALFGFILSILKNYHDSEDVMQDTYLKIRASAHLYNPYGKPMAWVFTIARRLCLMKIRVNSRTSTSSYDELENIIAQTTGCSIEDKVVLKALLHTLKDEERQIVILHAASGMKHREIAGIMNLPLATVLSKYNRSLAKLKKNLSANQ